MINLLNPGELKRIRAARVNVKLRKYLISTAITMLIIVGAYGVGYKFANDEYIAAESRNNVAQQKLSQYSGVKTEAASYRTNLDTAKKILGNEIVFSDFMTEVAKILPKNTVLNDLTLTTKKPTSAGSKQKAGAATLNARTKTQLDAIYLKTALEESDLFSSVSITSTVVKEAGDSTAAQDNYLERNYPYLVTFSLVIDQLGVKK